MDMVLKVAKNSKHHNDWTYLTGFNRVEKEDNWYIYLDKPAKTDENLGVGTGPSFKLKCETPGREPIEHSMGDFEWFVGQADLDGVASGEVQKVHVACVHLMVRLPEGGYRTMGSLLCNTAAFILNAAGGNIDRLV